MVEERSVNRRTQIQIWAGEPSVTTNAPLTFDNKLPPLFGVEVLIKRIALTEHCHWRIYENKTGWCGIIWDRSNAFSLIRPRGIGSDHLFFF
jgi:hypothetical protein